MAVVTAVLAGALLFGSAGDSSDGSGSDDVVEIAAMLSPHAYLYATYPTLAARLDCIIRRESRWDPAARNARSDAAGLTQMMIGTWLSTPQGKRGESRYDPYANLDAAAWLVTEGGGWRHWAATVGGCP